MESKVFQIGNNMILLEHVSKNYSGDDHALEDVSLHINPGEFVFICGKSGSGKSTLIRLLLKEIEPTSGKISVNGRNITKLKRRMIPLYRRNFGVVFQDFRLLMDRNVYDNVAFAQKAIEAPNRRLRSKVLSMLSLVNLMDKYKSNPKELSGGEQQRVAIARALINEPKILLCDEPTGNLDEMNSWEIMRLLESANEQGTTVVVVTHDLSIVNAMKKRTITIRDGRIIADRMKGGAAISED